MGDQTKGKSGPTGGEDHDLALLEVQLPETYPEFLKEIGTSIEKLYGLDEKGRPRLNPIFLARIAERVFFDGDVPEARFGPLPPEGKPAVPVLLQGYNPTLAGQKLQAAAEAVRKELTEAQENLNRSLFEKRDQIDFHRDFVPGAPIEGYAPATSPALRETSGDLAVPQEDKHLAWTSWSTTQGRKSFADLMERDLCEEFSLTRGEGSEVIEEFCWVLPLVEEADSNPKFNPMACAKASFEAKIRRTEKRHDRLYVKPINEIHNRRVGWRCVLSKS